MHIKIVRFAVRSTFFVSYISKNQTYVHFCNAKYRALRADGANHLKAIKTQCHYLSEWRRKGAQQYKGVRQLSEQDHSSPHFHSILICQSEYTIKVRKEATPCGHML